MKTKVLSKVLSYSLMILLLLIGAAILRPSQAEATKSMQSTTTGESWRLGVTSEGTAAYTSIIGRNASEAAAFRSNRAGDSYYIFPAPGIQRTVQSAKLNIISRSGTYTDPATLSLEVIAYDGTRQHVATTSPINMKTAATGTWIEIQLSPNTANLQIDPGEFLAFHFTLDGTPEGDLDVRPVFEVDVQ